jgi:HSP20 family molecular chaperone IbpA
VHVLAVHLTPLLMRPYTERGWGARGAMGGVLGSISVDVCEKGDSYELHASLPGVPKKSVKVTSNPPHGQPSFQATQ